MTGIMEGPLSKWTNVMKGWQYRWFVLDDNAGLLSYYTSKEKMTRGVRRGCVRLKGAIVGIDDEDDTTLTVTVDMKVFHLQAKDAEEREKWIRALEDTILRHAQLQRRLDPNRPAPTMLDFDKKLTETDAYLQILIDQVKDLETRIEKVSEEHEKMRLCNVRDRVNEMLESIKHTIVQLQIAKNTTQPVNGVQVVAPSSFFQTSPSDSIRSQPSVKDLTTEVVSVISMEEEQVQVGIELGAECLETNKGANVASPSEVFVAHPSMGIPETSYSSSEDEDFFDASEYMGQQSPTHVNAGSKSLDVEETKQTAANGKPEPRFDSPDGSIDYDALYEDSDEDDLGSMDSHGNMISHLLSQVKIGMDLTKVVLPTFILERRSLLEMYADFFAHPDIFVSIADHAEPRDRMVQVVRWYLSAFHAGRRSEVAKKPYNPIIGETFGCWWDVNDEATSTTAVSDGPVPWCHTQQLTFIAEQVSHHPPVSAFYAEHYAKRISFCAHIWTKSKFLGLSVGVHHVGQGCVSVLDYDEEYIITFPNAYGRSILTVPWVELGGSVSITCAKTGYSASVEFLTKPFYGGRKNRITAEVFQPFDKKAFVTIAGEWNGAMVAKWADGTSEDFVNVNVLSTVRKRVRPIAEQGEFESRRLWREVTFGLKHNDIERATTSKSSLEHRQREEARIRKETGRNWETKLFRLVGDNWIYDRPLVKRLTLTGSSSLQEQ